MESLGLALLGCGAISDFHLMGLREGASRTRVTAAIDRDLDRAAALAEKTGARAFADFEQALAWGGFDAVAILLPHDLHEAFALRAFQAGRHVLLEKPMAPTLTACERILEAASKAGTVFMVAENAQYWPEVLTARELVRAGAIGELVTARGVFFTPPLPAYYGGGADGGERPWRFEAAAAGGGIAIDSGSHWLRPLRMWLGEVEEVVGATGRPFAAMEGESLVRALLRFDSGAVAVLDGMLTSARRAPEPLFRITGSEGEITVEGIGDVVLWSADHPRGERVGERQGYLKSYAGELADFEAACIDGRRPAAGPESSLGELRAALALYRSAESRRWEKVWE